MEANIVVCKFFTSLKGCNFVVVLLMNKYFFFIMSWGYKFVAEGGGGVMKSTKNEPQKL